MLIVIVLNHCLCSLAKSTLLIYIGVSTFYWAYSDIDISMTSDIISKYSDESSVAHAYCPLIAAPVPEIGLLQN